MAAMAAVPAAAGSAVDSLITAAAQALARGDLFGALNRVALRNDPPALALRGVAMAQLGDFSRAKLLLKRAAKGFGVKESVARARCTVAEAEIALVSRDLGWPSKTLQAAKEVLESRGDAANAAYAQYLQARRLLLIGQLDAADKALAEIDPKRLHAASRAAYELVIGGLAIRRLQTQAARRAFQRARRAANEARIPPVMAEVENAIAALDRPVARLTQGQNAPTFLKLDAVAALFASDKSLIVDACRQVLRRGDQEISLESRPILFKLVRALGAAWPADVSREDLIKQAFRTSRGDDSHRARLRVEMGRLRQSLKGMAAINATRKGFVLLPQLPSAPTVSVLTHPEDGQNTGILALLSDGELWSSSALALALAASQRTVQRALDELAAAGKVQALGHGRARRWMAPSIPGFPTTLLLPGPLPGD